MVGVAVVVIGGLMVFTLVGAALAKVFPQIGRDRTVGERDAATRLRARMRRQTRQTLLLIPAATAGFSKLGGRPELPTGLARPVGETGPLTFLAQVDFAEARASGGPDWLPQEGRLFAYHDEQRSGSAAEVRLHYVSTAFGPPATPRDAPPTGKRFGERRVGFLPLKSVPSLDWLGVDVAELDISEEVLDDLANLPDAPFGEEVQHRIGGYPSEIQDTSMALECEHLARGLEYTFGNEVESAVQRASKAWRLLLQIDSDPALKMNWGDGGRLYVFIRVRHAQAGDFSKTVTLSQSY